jgi:uncharacterized membrane protein
MKKNILFLLLILILTVFSWRVLVKPGYPSMHDDMQAMRVLQLDKCVKDAQIPCRWVPDMGYGYGYPQFNYYPPLPYYVMEAFHLVGFSILDSVKIGFILSFLLSAVTMFFLGKSLWGHWGGLVASIFYTYAPYRAMDVYNRGAVGEFWALAFFPLIFWAIYKFIREEKRIYLLWLAIGIGGLLLVHSISSMIFLPFLIGWALLLVFLFKKWPLLLKLFLGGVWGIGLAAFFILPMILEKQFAHTETLLMGYFNYLAHFVSWRQLFFSTHWGHGSSILGSNDDLSFSIGFLHWLLALLVVILAFWKRKDKKALLMISFLFGGGILATFMTHLRSSFIWNNLSVLAWLQFPWRFLVITIFLFSLLAGGVIKFASKKKVLISMILIFLVIFLNAGFFRPARWFDLSDQEKFSGELWEKQLTISIFDYLPVSAAMPPDKKAPEEPIFLEGRGEIIDYQKGTNWQKGKIRAFEESVVRLPVFYFPGWEVYLDGQKTDFSYDNSLGLPTLSLAEGEYQLEARLEDTLVRKISNLISFLSLLALFSFPFLGLKLKDVKS